MPFRAVEHPADVGIEVTAPDATSLFAEAARGLMHVINPSSPVAETQERNVVVEAADLAQLMVRWLSEVLYLFDTERFLTSSARVTLSGGYHLTATLLGELVDLQRHADLQEVKAVTYHHIRVSESAHGWSAIVFFDI